MPRTVRFLPLLLAAALGAADPVDLAGSWRFALDRDDQGVAQQWFARVLDRTVPFPCSLAERGIGDPVTLGTSWTGANHRGGWSTDPRYAPYRQEGAIKLSYWLQPDTVWKAPAWFQRDIEIPAAWSGRRVELSLERAHITTSAWLDGRALGSCDSLSTAHVYDLGLSVAPGPHVLTLRVDNRIHVDVGHDSHSISDHTQGNWNGVVGAVTLSATSPVWITGLRTDPDRLAKRVAVSGTLGNATRQAGQGTVTLTVSGEGATAPPVTVPVSWQVEGGSFSTVIPLGDGARTWDEFSPVTYHVEAVLAGHGSADHRCSTSFGLRDIATQGTRFIINGRPLFLRGTLECCIFPKTGHPPTDVAEWRRILGVARAHGLNHLRFHSWCPPEAAFQAGDELGFYFQIECASWANDSTTLGDGKPVDAWIHAETARILTAYGNHPSFILMLYGNEPGGPKHKQFLADWVTRCKALDPRRLYSSGSGWPQLAENQFHVTPDPRIQGWGQGLQSRINAKSPETVTDYRAYIAARTVPVISHEIGQWCVYPDLAERVKYTGHLKARNFDIFADFLAAAGMLDQAHDFLIASGKLQTLCYKEDIESALRTPGMGGFQLLDLHDFPGQGTALVGVLDPFWEGKGYVSPKEYSRFCNSTVPLARLAKRVFQSDETLDAAIEVAHFGAAPLTATATTWRLVGDDGMVAAQGRLPARDIPVDNGISLGAVAIPLATVPAPRRYRLEVALEGTPFANDWDVWVYPAAVDTTVPAGVTVAERLDEHVAGILAQGGRVLWTIPRHLVRTPAAGPIALGFSTIFWNTAWTNGQPPHTMGVRCDPRHPLFAAFPTDPWSGWQWWYLMHAAAPLLCDGLPPALRPAVQVVDDWFTCHRIGLVVEARVGDGRLLITSVPLAAPADPVTRQFRRALLDYAAGTSFQPTVTLTLDQARSFFAEPAMTRLGAQVEADSAAEGFPASNAIDGLAATCWHTPWQGAAPPFPHQLTVRFREATALAGVTLTPRQDAANGRIRDYALYVSADGLAWEGPVVTGTCRNDGRMATIRLPAPRTVRGVRLEARSGFGPQPFVALAEFDLIPAGR